MPLELPPGLWMPPKPGIIRAAPDISAPYLGAFTMLARTSMLRAKPAAAGGGGPIVTNIGTNSNTSGATIAVTVGAAGVPATATIVVCNAFGLSGGIGGGTSGVTDTAGNTYIQAGFGNALGPSADLVCEMWYCLSASALSNGNTITLTKAGSTYSDAMSAFYVSPGMTSISNEFTLGTSGASTAPSITSNSGASTLWAGLVASKAASGDTFTQDSVNGAWATPPTRVASSAFVACIAGGTLAQSIAVKTYAPTLGTSREWAMAIVGFS